LNDASQTTSFDDIAIVAPAEFPEFFMVPWPIIPDDISHLQGLTLKVRSVSLTHLNA
jgi:hypothetical protein